MALVQYQQFTATAQAMRLGRRCLEELRPWQSLRSRLDWRRIRPPSRRQRKESRSFDFEGVMRYFSPAGDAAIRAHVEGLESM